MAVSAFDFDLFTIGAGSGGVAASRRAAAYGARVAICENSRVGGTCVIRGCVPKKLLVYGAQYADAFADAAGYGWSAPEATFDWPSLIARKDAEIDRLNGLYIRMLENAGARLMMGTGRVVDPHTVEVDGKRFTARHILIATGARPVRPAIPGIEHAITSNEALHLERLPSSILILGGGYIALEFASIFRAFGAAVTVMIRGEAILRGFDDDVRRTLTTELERRGVTIVNGVQPTRIEKTGDGVTVFDQHGHPHVAEVVMAALGRDPNIAGLGLDDLGIVPRANGAVPVDAWNRTSVGSVFAIGDVTDRVALTPIAIAEGRALADTLFHDTPTQPNYDNIPTAVFSLPPVGTVGLSEMDARERFGAVDIYKTGFRPMKHTLSGREERVFMKLVVDAASQRVVGCHMVGMDAPEIVQGLAIALNAGATKAVFDRTVALHPSTSEEWVLMREKS